MNSVISLLWIQRILRILRTCYFEKFFDFLELCDFQGRNSAHTWAGKNYDAVSDTEDNDRFIMFKKNLKMIDNANKQNPLALFGKSPTRPRTNTSNVHDLICAWKRIKNYGYDHRTRIRNYFMTTVRLYALSGITLWADESEEERGMRRMSKKTSGWANMKVRINSTWLLLELMMAWRRSYVG